MVDDVNALVAIIKMCDDITISSPLFKNALYSKVRAFGTNETILAAVPQNATLQTLKSIRCSEGEFGLSLLEIVEAISTNFDGISKSSEADGVAKYFFGSPDDFSLTLSVIRSSSALINPLLYRAVLDRYQSLEPTTIVRRRFIAYVLGFWHQHNSDADSFETQLIVDSWAENTMDLREISLVSQNQAVLAQLPSQRAYSELLDENAKKNVSYKLVQANLSLDEGLSSWLERTNEFFDYFGLYGLNDTRVSQFSKLEFSHQPCELTETNETVTIAMPAFNAEETIESSIRSLPSVWLAQTREFEF
jgi:glycosyltransferase involved in cell wall biosynthesis